MAGSRNRTGNKIKRINTTRPRSKGENRQKPEKKFNKTMQVKLLALFATVLVAMGLLIVVLTLINVKHGDTYKKQVMSQAQQKYESRVLPAKRGNIYDRNGNLLATSNKVYTVILDCLTVTSSEAYIDPTVEAMVEYLGVDEADIRERLTKESTRDSQYQIVKRELPVDAKKAFEDYRTVPADSTLSEDEKKKRRNVKGVWFEEDYLRIYPYGSLACDTIGFTHSRDVADIGLEGYYNSTLSGVDGRQYGYFNSEADVEQTIIEPAAGKSIETTLDVGVQKIVERYVDAFNESMGAKHVGVIVEDPRTGEILAIDGGDRYDLNEPRDMSNVYSEYEISAMNDAETVEALNMMWSNFCITDAYEPGSVVKPIVMSAALEKGKISESDTFECDGYENFGAVGSITTIKCTAYPSGHGKQTLADVIANSCNDGMMQIAAAMGSEQFIKSQSLFNFGTRTGIDLPNEGTGIIHTTSTMGETELACSSFGQGFTCTMIQEINAMSSVINGGYYFQPRLLTKIKDANGGTIKSYSETLLKQTISARISADIRSYMELSVKKGTSVTSKVQGYSSGGKTGTAEKFPRGNGKYLVSFIGFAPVDDPQVLLYVVVDEPNAEDQANSAFAQYIAQGILSELLPYLNIRMDEVNPDWMPETELWEGFTGLISGTDSAIIDDYGNLLDEHGNRIDWDGNRVDSEGYLLDEDGNYRIDDYGNNIMSTALEKKSGEGSDGISNTSAPAPLQDHDDPYEGNNMESEGVTNEEAGMG